jgi:dynein heavy chain
MLAASAVDDDTSAAQVQRNWMYLENIFVGSEDIRKQLPQESLMFDGVNRVFQQSMAQLQAVGNVIQATNTPNVLSTFQVSGTHSRAALP